MQVVTAFHLKLKGGKIMKQYDYLIVGSGLFGSVFAHEATKHGKKCLVIDKRSHLGIFQELQAQLPYRRV